MAATAGGRPTHQCGPRPTLLSSRTAGVTLLPLRQQLGGLQQLTAVLSLPLTAASTPPRVQPGAAWP